MFRDCDLKLSCGPVLNMKNGGSRKEECVVLKRSLGRKSVCA